MRRMEPAGEKIIARKPLQWGFKTFRREQSAARLEIIGADGVIAYRVISDGMRPERPALLTKRKWDDAKGKLNDGIFSLPL
ncbi:hypothetical protein Noc_0313 [Nitrosococcus oceani ATCC 19707]|uniref:Uncharacterized protein n=2 Tax=Nitrosococcus oceani TaxID=1229 RepID=Q3JEA5_NITOC|nr:hypothetical protein Noc_0313 [Nitrosococcus oceani ATCC 19707]